MKAIFIAYDQAHHEQILEVLNMNLAVAFNKFYHDCVILKAEETAKQARLALTELTQRVLYDSCGLLGIECPDEM